MPGEPTEVLIGVGGVGFGVLLLYSAYKNKNPVDIIRQAVTTGKLDIGSAGSLFSGGGSGQFLGKIIVPSSVTSAIADIQKKDPGLASNIQAQVNSIDTSKSYTTGTKQLFDLMSQARSEGFNSQADAIEAWVNSLKFASTSTATTGGGTVFT